MSKYADIVFLQGDDYNEFEKATGYDGWSDPEWVARAVEYLAQWDCGDSPEGRTDPTDEPGTVIEHGAYVLTLDPSYGWAGMCRKIS